MKSLLLIAGLVASFTLAACSTAPSTEGGKTGIREDAANAVAAAERADPSLAPVLQKSKGYAVFPVVGKGAVGVGGAYGKGVLFESGNVTGYCDLSQASIGLALGGQGYTEIIAFNTAEALARFKTGNFAFGAQATAVAIKSGAGANAKYDNGVAVFTMAESGLMFEASIGGQKFGYEAK